jgi:serine/threonine protein phosphatase PrpC
MEDAARDARRHQLLSALTGREIAMIDLCAAPVSLQKGDIAILASDGIETLTPERIADHFQHRRHASLETIATSLLMEIMEIARPEQDNTSLVLCSVGD